jgi:SAM-dependent methyltransferase
MITSLKENKGLNLRYDTFNPYIFAEIPNEVKILDAGCGTGLLGKRLIEQRKVRYLAGIEKDPRMAEIARANYGTVINMDLEEMEHLPFEKEYFDVIICSDVLEHLKNPLEILKKLSVYLSRNGFFLISIPNIAFVSVRWLLLFGKFDYNPRGGILDESHLRFFTKKSFINLLEKADLEPFYIKNYNLVKPKFFFLKVLSFFFPNLFSIQFIVKAKKILHG